MTQVASRSSVLGDFNDVTLDYFGKQFHLQQRDGEYWIAQAGGRTAKVLQTTGSHHYQVYWVNGGRGNILQNFPFVYLLDDQRWARRNDVFMMPPHISSQPESIRPWNDSCISCHATHGQAKINLEARHANTQIAELGISCEACHGPAAEHVHHYSNPLARYRQYWDDQSVTAIVNPANCDAKTSTQICGQCHGVSRELDRKAWSDRGFAFRPGDELVDSRIVARHPAKTSQPLRSESNSSFYDKYFWSDGMIRVSGREYNGLLETPCYQRGEMSCLSCHSMHDSDPNDQIKTGMSGSAACTQCHADIASDIPAHTHHDATSSGSQCYNCHMPHTTYGLLKAIRSHQIDSPSVDATLATGRPQACNLCHLDKTLAWTAEHLESWYGQPIPQLTDQQKVVSAMVLDLLSGDAGQRAIAAWHMGWQPALDASGRDWLAPLLAELLDDPYAVVRYIAYHSIRRLTGFADFDFDFAASEGRRAKTDEVRRLWQAVGTRPQPNAETLINETGELMMDRMEEIIRQRDDRPVDLLE